MKRIILFVALIFFCSCTSKKENSDSSKSENNFDTIANIMKKFDSYFSENLSDTIHVYSLDMSFFKPGKTRIDFYKLPDSLYKINDTMFEGKEIPIVLVQYFRLDDIHDSLFNSQEYYINDNKYYGVSRYKISNDYSGYIVAVTEPFKYIALYIFNNQNKKFEGIIILAQISNNMSEDYDCNSWIFDIDNDGVKDILSKCSAFSYGEMDNLRYSDSTLSNAEIIDSLRYDSAWTYIWTSNKFVYKPLKFKSTKNKFQYKMLEYYKGYRGCYWFN